VIAAGPLSVVALVAGWVTTEVGRQPWVVYDVMRTSQAVTNVPDLPIGYGTLAAVYLGVALAVLWLLRRLARAPMDTPPEAGPGTPRPGDADTGPTQAGAA
jgi:cytochrome d ubiquinol oxidase subunit I